MDENFKTILWQQFGAAIDMLGNAIEACPENIWSDNTKRPEWKDDGIVGFWYLVYHTLFWLDLYLSGKVEEFKPPHPFDLKELEPAGLLPERPYTKEQMMSYLNHCRKECRTVVMGLTKEKAHGNTKFGWGEASFAELLFYNMRHVQHHAAQLNLILRQETNTAPGWVAKAKE
jgi:DinB family protein